MIFDGEKERHALDETFDYVIVGSGAAGATAARVLADTGAHIAVVEEGPAVTTADFGDRAFPAFRQMFRQMGTQVAHGRAVIPILQGSCLGGSTVINSAIVWRIPDDVWQPWKTEYGLGDTLPLDTLHRYWDQIEGELSTRATAPAIWGENNRMMDVARNQLGVAAAPMRRNESGCRGSARCSLGCPHGAKQSMLVRPRPGPVFGDRPGQPGVLLVGDGASVRDSTHECTTGRWCDRDGFRCPWDKALLRD